MSLLKDWYTDETGTYIGMRVRALRYGDEPRVRCDQCKQMIEWNTMAAQCSLVHQHPSYHYPECYTEARRVGFLKELNNTREFKRIHGFTPRQQKRVELELTALRYTENALRDALNKVRYWFEFRAGFIKDKMTPAMQAEFDRVRVTYEADLNKYLEELQKLLKGDANESKS